MPAAATATQYTVQCEGMVKEQRVLPKHTHARLPCLYLAAEVMVASRLVAPSTQPVHQGGQECCACQTTKDDCQ